MTILKQMKISGYKSIENADLEFRNLNVLIGANGSGKSNFISVFRLLQEAMRTKLKDFVARSGGSNSLLHYGAKFTPHCEIRLDFESDSSASIHYEIRLSPSASGEMYVDSEKIVATKGENNIVFESQRKLSESAIDEGPAESMSIVHVLKEYLWNTRVYHIDDTSKEASIRQQVSIGDNRILKKNMGNLAAVLHRMSHSKHSVESGRYRRIVETLRQFLPWFDDFVVEPLVNAPDDVRLEWREKWSERLFAPHEIPDGALRAMALTTLLLQPKQFLPQLVIIDEPELGLHPSALCIIAALLKEASLHTQVIVATQSPTLLDEFDPEDVIVVDREKGSSTFVRQSPIRLNEWLEDYSLGEIWQKNVIGGGPF